MNNSQTINNLEITDDIFGWKMMRGVFQIGGIMWLGFSITNLQGVIDQYGRQPMMGVYLEDLISLFATISFAIGWFTLRGIDCATKGGKVKAKFLFWVAILILEIVVFIIYTQSVDWLTPQFEISMMMAYFWLSGNQLRAGMINFVRMRRNVKRAFQRKVRPNPA